MRTRSLMTDRSVMYGIRSRHNGRVSTAPHDENFPVASWLCPPHLRPPIRAIYAFARTADDIADEGDASPATRLADLHAFRADLEALARGAEPSPRWPQVFAPLAAQMARHGLPAALLDDLLDAFIQDVTVHAHADRAAVLDYCRRSADPVGRLLLHLYGIGDAASLAQSDAVCSGLQLANFWQDLSVDLPRGRVYVPATDLARRGIGADALRAAARGDAPVPAGTDALLAELIGWARGLLQQGVPLVHRVPGRAGFELRLVVQGGLGILDRVERLGTRVLRERPTLGLRDAPRLTWRALVMRPAPIRVTHDRHAAR